MGDYFEPDSCRNIHPTTNATTTPTKIITQALDELVVVTEVVCAGILPEHDVVHVAVTERLVAVS